MTKKRMENDKRIIIPVTEKSEEEDEEETMEAFYAMIRDYSRRKNELKNRNIMQDELEKTTILRRKGLEKKRKAGDCSGWVPSFRWEDFNDDKKKMIKLTNSSSHTINTNVVVNRDAKVITCKMNDKKRGLNLDLKLAL